MLDNNILKNLIIIPIYNSRSSTDNKKQKKLFNKIASKIKQNKLIKNNFENIIIEKEDNYNYHMLPQSVVVDNIYKYLLNKFEWDNKNKYLGIYLDKRSLKDNKYGTCGKAQNKLKLGISVVYEGSNCLQIDTCTKIAIHEALHLAGIGHCRRNTESCIMRAGKTFNTDIPLEDFFKKIDYHICDGDHPIS